MIALDTNLLLRLATHDDPAQLAALERFLAAHPHETFLIPDVVLVETVWSLRAAYGWSRPQLVETVRRLAGRLDVDFEDRTRVMDAVRELEAGGDFADALIVSRARGLGCSGLATFDADLARRHPDFVIRPR